MQCAAIVCQANADFLAEVSKDQNTYIITDNKVNILLWFTI